MRIRKFDLAACLVVPAIVLALTSVSVLSFRVPTHADAMPHGSMQAATVSVPTAASANNPVPSMQPVDNDGDGDELLEHWGDPKYSKEERIQLAGMGALFLGVAAMQWKRALRTRRPRNAAKA